MDHDQPFKPYLAPGDDPYTRPYSRPSLPGEASWGRAPVHHYGDYVYPGRAVLVLAGRNWEYEPEHCPVSPMDPCLVLFGGDVVACRGCGLDST